MMTDEDLTAYLRALYTYDPLTGNVTRKYKIGQHKAGETIGSYDDAGYIKVSVYETSYRLHTIIWLMVYGRRPDEMIDHIDGDRTNNRQSNLREVTHTQNQWNLRSKNPNRASGVKGVYYTPRNPSKPWAASINNKGNNIHLGYFADVATAEQAWLNKCYELRGEYMPQELRDKMKGT
jgi:hypothetical protein